LLPEDWRPLGLQPACFLLKLRPMASSILGVLLITVILILFIGVVAKITLGD
jgi:hypothetical protein